MNNGQPSGSMMQKAHRAISRVAATTAALAVGFAAFGLAAAAADPYGELAKVPSTWGAGKAGQEELGRFYYPTGLTIDTTDNSVYVLDEPEGTRPGFGSENFRLQKFSSSLPQTPAASAKIPTPPQGLNGNGKYAVGIAVDSTLGRIYVLEAAYTERGGVERFAASRIVAYSTDDKGTGTLPLASGVETKGNKGVYYEYPEVTETTEPAGSLFDPQGIAVDPTTHNLYLLGRDALENTEIELIKGAGAEPFVDGALDEAETFDDKGELSGEGFEGASGIIVAPDGSLYANGHNITGGTSGALPGVAKLSIKSPHSLAHPQISVVQKEKTGESPPLDGGETGNGRGVGPQVAISPEAGGLIYAVESTSEEQSAAEPEPLPGNFEIRGMSTADGAQQVVFGGSSSTTCRIGSKFNAIVAGSGGVVYALDEGSFHFNGEGETEPTPYGSDVVKFGPGGSGCPEPVTSFKINNDENSALVQVGKGAAVKLLASEAKLNGAKASELIWQASGPAHWEETVIGGPPALEVSHHFIVPGVYTVELQMNVAGSTFGPPPVVVRKIEVTAPTPTASFEASSLTPKPEEEVTFNGEESVDPAGTCSESTGCSASHKLKSYMWEFGDGTSEKTSSAVVKHKFVNTGTQPVQRTVTLTVTDEEEVQSVVPASLMLTIQAPVVGKGPSKEPLPQEPPAKEPLKEPIKEALPDRSATNVSPSAVAGAGLVKLGLSCPITKLSCAGTVLLKATPKKHGSSKAKAKTAPETVGRASFSLMAGAKKTLTIRLDSTGMTLLKREKSLRLQVLVSAHDSFGDPRTVTLNVTLKAPKAKKKK